MPKWRVEHEQDDLPTYVVNPEDEEQSVEFLPSIPWPVRVRAAHLLADILSAETPEG